MEKSRNESLEENVQKLRDCLKELETRIRESCFSDGYESVKFINTVG